MRVKGVMREGVRGGAAQVRVRGVMKEEVNRGSVMREGEVGRRGESTLVRGVKDMRGGAAMMRPVVNRRK